jgi:uncharacterized protein YmfQ (DUF2313 family)
MSLIVDKILKLTKQLYPKGRAFKIPENGWYYRLHKGLAQSEARVYNEALGVLDSILPDNDNFTAQDATDWERRLGLINGTGVSLADRKAAIRRKMNHPGNVKPRENWMFLESQLQLAGFRVWVHENRFSDGMGGFQALDPIDALPAVDYGEHGEYEHGEIEHGDAFSYYQNLFTFAEHGEFEHGEMEHDGWIYNNVVANYIPESLDAMFNVGPSHRATFFICAEPFGVFAEVPASRKDEFRQLILKLKEVNTVAYLLVNYI